MSLEWEIHHKLTEPQDPATVAESLVAMWKQRDLKLADKIAIASFLLNSGRKQTLMKLVMDSVERDEDVPWGQLAEVCRDLDIPPSVVEAILEGAESQGLSDQLLRSNALDRKHPRIKEARGLLHRRIREQQQNQRQTLLDKLEYLRSQRMFDEEGRAVREFAKMFPHDPEYTKIVRSYEERWAREIIAQKSSQAKVLETVPRLETKSPDQELLERVVVDAVQRGAKEHPNSAYDLSILLYFLELYQPAQIVLARAKPTVATDWFGLELMLKGRQFVEALEDASRLEAKYALDPEATFAVTYARARALHGLGQNQNAVELLQSILQIRPDYRSAQVLLEDWSGGRS